MKTKEILFSVGVLLAFLSVTLLNSCDLIKDDDPDPDPTVADLGKVLWTYEDFHLHPVASDPVSITAPALGTDGTIYVASYDRVGAEWQNARVHAINADSTFKWVSPELDGVDVTSPAVGEDGNIYVISYTTVYSLSAADGNIIWSYQPPLDSNEQHQISWLTLGNNGEIYFAHVASGAYGRKIYALSSNGQVIWKRRVDWGANNLVVGLDGTLFAYWQANGDIYTFGAFDPANGTSKWTKILEGNLQGPNGVAVAPDGDLIVSQSSPHKLLKINANSGETIWQVDAERGYPSVASDGSIYLLLGNLFCYSSGGSLKWQTGSQVGMQSKIALDNEGNAYGSASDFGDGNFQVYKPDGTVKWARVQNMTLMHCPAIGTNKIIYVTSGNPAILYAIQGDKPLATSGWPRDTGGNRNSRNVNLH